MYYGIFLKRSIVSMQVPLHFIQTTSTSMTTCSPITFARAQVSKTKALLFHAITVVNILTRAKLLAGLASSCIRMSRAFRALAPYIFTHVPSHYTACTTDFPQYSIPVQPRSICVVVNAQPICLFKIKPVQSLLRKVVTDSEFC